ncbi:PEP-CTERM sorting domain-containing protein [Lyngbya sp. CCY1209]|uniref:PEP-CTERM sorting domain-containing protein n=1 Tax=Lyngbya sp. CCY1209 TaxID=2886103 RepID=UPI002D20FE51|nr:PEP-CTERM sorting domain-containing protein [Lyngbya sp. CCY1209]MEB3886030.1 PEP-CTERM sorting domain-containing protein [Lyngbya sp. CCY1209]
MKIAVKKIASSCGIGLLSVLAIASPGTAAVFYDLEFFDREQNLIGTGEFSHEDDPFEAVVELCPPSMPSFLCGETLEITREDQFFRVTNFSSTVPGLGFSLLIEGERTDLFWRPFDEERVASISPCRSRYCGGRKLFFNENSWFDGIGRSEVTSIRRMTATEWSSVLDGSSIPEQVKFDLSGTWTATRRTSVPEPASIFGLIAIGALGSLRLKRGDG